MDSQSRSFSFIETSGLKQQAIDGGATDYPVATKPAAAKRDHVAISAQPTRASSINLKAFPFTTASPARLTRHGVLYYQYSGNARLTWPATPLS